jgi:valyl-tRNA synthetase
MSKSLGNVIDPLDVINGRLGSSNQASKVAGGKAMDASKQDQEGALPACGADALRLTLLSYMDHGRPLSSVVIRCYPLSSVVIRCQLPSFFASPLSRMTIDHS